ncbi:3-hydroxyisobutyrate dehydrogenase [Punctularia strigosozonata HHB-11173 SS5]|uniref:3-hydroxyisobutyrate dehydrogenase n=1 Tax=Punctularia strigosozonata (strain HHB-11173) TaxID=741275 RepID=UPI0004418107|nr:3-hydroxyisobutyrate dehydrogenase [Punctularia strigosozonata HHB-11173 SS5]EIN07680.1 3-hydroxyisobutyrate dehydrogenase [Punctularia strigosozonata HHB-11173 SS5]
MRPSFRCLQVLHSASPRAKSVSFIGLGHMGREMAFNLFSKQLALEPETSRFVVCDAIPEAAQAFQRNFEIHFPGSKITIAKTPAEAALASQTVITMLPSSPHVQQVYTQPDSGILPALRTLSEEQAEDSLFIDSTTLDVRVAQDVAELVARTGGQMVDAPVSGGVVGAKAGTLSFLVGGTEEAYHLASPLLARMGQRIIHCGPSGSGLAAKICNNLVLGIQQIAISEAMLLGQGLGLDPAVLAGVVNSSTGNCWASNTNNPVPGALPEKSPPCERDYEGGFATALMLKDLGLASSIAKARNSPLPLGEVAEKIYAQVIDSNESLIRKDFSSVYLHLRDQMERR